MTTEVVKVTGNAVTIVSSIGVTYINNVDNISYVEQHYCEAWKSKNGFGVIKEHPPVYVIYVSLYEEAEKGKKTTRILRVQCADANETNHIITQLVSALEQHNLRRKTA